MVPKSIEHWLRKVLSEAFGRPSGRRFLDDVWAHKKLHEVHFVLYFTRISAFRGVVDGASKGLFHGWKIVLKNDSKRDSKRVTKWAPEGRPRPQKDNMWTLRQPAVSLALLRKAPSFLVGVGFVLFVF